MFRIEDATHYFLYSLGKILSKAKGERSVLSELILNHPLIVRRRFSAVTLFISYVFLEVDGQVESQINYMQMLANNIKAQCFELENRVGNSLNAQSIKPLVYLLRCEGKQALQSTR